MRHVWRIGGGVLGGLAAVAAGAGAQFPTWPPSPSWGVSERVLPNPSYDGRFAFARLRYSTGPMDPCTCPVGGGAAMGWAHDYPDGERNLMRIMTDVTTLRPHLDSSVVVSATDPALMKYPILYLSEPGCWNPSDKEVAALRKYLQKGGFLIVDDFSMCTGGPYRYALSMKIFEQQIRRVLPEGKLTEVSFNDPTMNEFFRMDPDRVESELTRNAGAGPRIFGIYDHNDPHQRLLVAANYNTVIHRSWVWEAQGVSSVESGNEAYKLGVNYLLYGFTH